MALSSGDGAKASQDFDFLIIGSGFGGSVSAFRLAQKGYKVAVLEKGKRFQKTDFAKSNWNIFKFLWAPFIRCFGIQQFTLLKGVMVLHGAGVGGGSLVYANTLMQPREKAFLDPSWPQSVDWQKELLPFYKTAKQMLGVNANQLESAADLEIKKLAQGLGVGETYHRTEVGVFFGSPGAPKGQEFADPYFAGKGPARTTCTGCGGCMVGCRVGAKNTLDLNYLYLAEKLGVEVFPETLVTKITPPLGPDGLYVVDSLGSTTWGRLIGLPLKQQFRAKNIILAAGVLGTLELLLKNRDYYKTLPKLSYTLGDFVRTNGESLCGATAFGLQKDFSTGIAIGSAIHIDEDVKIEPVRYPAGSNALRLLAVPLTSAGGPLLRPLKLLGNLILKPVALVRYLLVKDWAQQTIILLVMQTLNEKIKLKMQRSFWTGFSPSLARADDGQKIPSYIPIAQEASQRLAAQIDGLGQNIISEVALGIPATAHILGGAVLGDTAATSVCNLNHEVHGYRGLYVCDASVIPANLGVNPSLTITALAERFTSLILPKASE